MKRSDKIISFITKYMRVPEGKLVGQEIQLADFQKKFIEDVYDNPSGTRRAILSMGRKNAKTTTIAFLVLSHLVGPEAKQNSQIVAGAMSREQAAIIFELMCKIIYQNEELSKLVRIIPSKKMLVGLPMNVTFQALAADGKTAVGLSPLISVIDEAGQVVGAKSDFISAIETGAGAHESPLTVYISTQAANDGDYLSILIDDAKKTKSANVVCHVYEADDDCDLLDEKQWKKANPALGKFRSFEDVKEQAHAASRMPSMENSFRNLILNQRVSLNSPFISKSAWLECLGDVPDIQECEEVYGGLDLSGKTDLTCLALLGLKDETWYPYIYAWTPHEGLIDRSTRDRAPYDIWAREGYLMTTQGASIDYEDIARELFNILDGVNLISIAYDRWRMDILEKELDRINLDLPLQPWGQGFKDMSPALDSLEGRILNKKIIHNNHPVLNMCLSNSMVTKNPAGDRKLDKVKTSGRIDCAVALAMACGVADRMHDDNDLSGFINDPLVL